MEEIDLADWADEPVTETVKIGKREVMIRAITDPTQMGELILAARGREVIPFEVDGKKTKVSESEAMLYTWLAAGAVEPQLSYKDVLRISKRTGFDCIQAGEQVMRLSGVWDDKVGDAKNDFGEKTPQEDGTEVNTPSDGSGEFSPPV